MSRSDCNVCTEFWWCILGHVFVCVYIDRYICYVFFVCLFVCYCGSARVHPVFLLYCHQQGGSVKEQLAARSSRVLANPMSISSFVRVMVLITLHQLGMIWIVLDITSWLMTLLPWTLHSRLVSFHSRNRFEGFRELKKCQDLSDVLQALACQTAAWAHEGSTLIVLIVNTGWYAVYKSWWPLWKRDAPRSWLSCQDPSIHGIGDS